ncbi:ABC transporter permease [Miniphocaeibacter massiliensis]|uniref:ABC transporter permease n=1 Tax=Miniphocaeibacter massiliensis TaxID=2041841 RepID=UPI000C06920A|nr:ABC transporter permease [Miniphocaeibacter massiliensis]
MRTLKNYFKIIYKNKFSILLYIAMFVALLSITNYSTEEDLHSNYRINIVDKVKNEDSKNLINFLDDKYRVTISDMSKEEAKDLLFGHMSSYVLFIGKDNNISYFANENTMDSVEINMSINEYLSTTRTLNTFNIENSYKTTVDILSDDTDFEILNSSDKSITEGYYIYLTYIILIIILSVVLLAYYSFLKDGVQNRIRISKTKLSKFNLSLYLSSTILIIVFCLGFSLFEFFTNKSSIEKLPLFFLNLVLFAIPISIAAYIISSLSKNVKLNGSMNNIISLVLCFISGVFVQQEFLPEYLLKISSIFPPYWYMEGITAVAKSNYSSLTKVFVIQGIMTIVLILLNSILTRYKKGDFSYSR